MKKDIRLVIRVTPDLHIRLKDVADKLEMGVSPLLRLLAQDFCDNYEKGNRVNLKSRVTADPTSVKDNVALTNQVNTGLTKADWERLDFAARTDVIKSYRAYKRGQEYDKSLEEYFKFVEGAS